MEFGETGLRIAIPSTSDKGLDSYVSRHFGHAPYYTLIEIEGGKIRDIRAVPMPYREHWPGAIPSFIKSLGVEVVIAYSIEQRTQEYFRDLGIRVILGAHGRIGSVISRLLEGKEGAKA